MNESPDIDQAEGAGQYSPPQEMQLLSDCAQRKGSSTGAVQVSQPPEKQQISSSPS